jgi:hypothetical protein
MRAQALNHRHESGSERTYYISIWICGHVQMHMRDATCDMALRSALELNKEINTRVRRHDARVPTAGLSRLLTDPVCRPSLATTRAGGGAWWFKIRYPYLLL